jgi:hypothetical protein
MGAPALAEEAGERVGVLDRGGEAGDGDAGGQRAQPGEAKHQLIAAF